MFGVGQIIQETGEMSRMGGLLASLHLDGLFCGGLSPLFNRRWHSPNKRRLASVEPACGRDTDECLLAGRGRAATRKSQACKQSKAWSRNLGGEFRESEFSAPSERRTDARDDGDGCAGIDTLRNEPSRERGAKDRNTLEYLADGPAVTCGNERKKDGFHGMDGVGVVG